MSNRSIASHLFANRTIIDNFLDGRRGRIMSMDPDKNEVTVMWPGGQYNSLKMEPGRFSVVQPD